MSSSSLSRPYFPNTLIMRNTLQMPDEERELLEKESRECLHRPTAAVPPSSSRGVRGSAEDKRVSSGAPSSRTAGSASKPAPGPQSHPSAYSDAAISQYVSLGYSKEHVIRTFNVMRERGVPLNKTEEALDLLDEVFLFAVTLLYLVFFIAFLLCQALVVCLLQWRRRWCHVVCRISC